MLRFSHLVVGEYWEGGVRHFVRAKKKKKNNNGGKGEGTAFLTQQRRNPEQGGLRRVITRVKGRGTKYPGAERNIGDVIFKNLYSC